MLSRSELSKGSWAPKKEKTQKIYKLARSQRQISVDHKKGKVLNFYAFFSKAFDELKLNRRGVLVVMWL